MITGRNNNNNKTKHAHKQADYLTNIKLGKQNFDVIQIKRLLLRVIRKKNIFFFFFFFKSDYNRSDEYMDLIQLPSYNHVHYTIVDLMGLTLVFIATRHYQNTDKRIDHVVY